LLDGTFHINLLFVLSTETVERAEAIIGASIEDAGHPQQIIGLKVDMCLEEHHYRKKFLATIVGPVSVADEPFFDGMHLFKLDTQAAENLSVNHVLFLPQVYRFHGVILFRKGRIPRPREPYRASLEKFLLSRNPGIRAIEGRVYTSSHEKSLRETMCFQSRYEFSMLSYGLVTRPRKISE
jgi:hypothetical protein